MGGLVRAQIATGRFGSATEVVREALRLLEERQRKLAELDVAIEKGLADARAGRVRPADEAFDEFEARYAAMEAGGKHG